MLEQQTQLKPRAKKAPSVDAFGRITFTPKAKSYRPVSADIVGKQVDIITCLNTSETEQIKRNGHNAKQLITRVYSMKTNGRHGRLLGHGSRFRLRDVSPELWSEGRDIVLRDNSKIPHAWLRGIVVEVLENEDYQRHHALLNEFRSNDRIVYDPYISDSFRALSKGSYLTQEATGKKFYGCSEVYCFESGIIGKNIISGI